MIEQLRRIFNLADKEIVTYEDLENAEVGYWYNLTTQKMEEKESALTCGVWYKRINTKSAGQLVFMTRIFNGFGFHYHSHDCKETLTPLNGDVLMNGYRVLKKNQTETLFAYTKHKTEFLSSDNSEYVDLFVEFNR